MSVTVSFDGNEVKVKVEKGTDLEAGMIPHIHVHTWNGRGRRHCRRYLRHLRREAMHGEHAPACGHGESPPHHHPHHHHHHHGRHHHYGRHHHRFQHNNQADHGQSRDGHQEDSRSQATAPGEFAGDTEQPVEGVLHRSQPAEEAPAPTWRHRHHPHRCRRHGRRHRHMEDQHADSRGYHTTSHRHGPHHGPPQSHEHSSAPGLSPHHEHEDDGPPPHGPTPPWEHCPPVTRGRPDRPRPPRGGSPHAHRQRPSHGPSPHKPAAPHETHRESEHEESPAWSAGRIQSDLDPLPRASNADAELLPASRLRACQAGAEVHAANTSGSLSDPERSRRHRHRHERRREPSFWEEEDYGDVPPPPALPVTSFFDAYARHHRHGHRPDHRHRHHASQYYDAFENDCSPGMIEVERKVSGGLESVTFISLPPRAAQGGDRGQCEQPATSAAERQGDIAQEGNWDGLEYNNQPELDLFEPVTTRRDSRSAFSYAATSHGVHGQEAPTMPVSHPPMASVPPVAQFGTVPPAGYGIMPQPSHGFPYNTPAWQTAYDNFLSVTGSCGSYVPPASSMDTTYPGLPQYWPPVHTNPPPGYPPLHATSGTLPTDPVTDNHPQSSVPHRRETSAGNDWVPGGTGLNPIEGQVKGSAVARTPSYRQRPMEMQPQTNDITARPPRTTVDGTVVWPNPEEHEDNRSRFPDLTEELAMLQLDALDRQGVHTDNVPSAAVTGVDPAPDAVTGVDPVDTFLVPEYSSEEPWSVARHLAELATASEPVEGDLIGQDHLHSAAQSEGSGWSLVSDSSLEDRSWREDFYSNTGHLGR